MYCSLKPICPLVHQLTGDSTARPAGALANYHIKASQRDHTQLDPPRSSVLGFWGLSSMRVERERERERETQRERERERQKKSGGERERETLNPKQTLYPLGKFRGF